MIAIRGAENAAFTQLYTFTFCVHYFHLWFVPIKCAKVHRMIETTAYTLCTVDLYLYSERGTETDTDNEK